MSGIYVGLALVAGAVLLYEIALTRIFAIAQGYHFGFLAISLALLGFGASGAALALRSPLSRGTGDGHGVGVPLARLALFCSISLPASYLAANYLPFDAYRIAWEPQQFVYLAAYLLALAAPFFLAGLAQGWALAAWSERAAALYAANLLGSGLGCVAALAALSWSSGPGAVVLAALLAAGATCILARASSRSARWIERAAVAAVASCALWLWLTPSWFDLRLSPYRALSQILNYPDARLVARRWNALARVDVVASSNIRSAPGLSLAFTGALPRQTGLVVDADNVLALARDNPSRDFLDALPMALPYRLRPSARALIVEPGGGLDVLVALEGGAASIAAVEKNPLVVELIQTYAGHIYNAPRTRFIAASARGYLARGTERFDVIELALSGNFRAVTAGAFTLSEDYLLTVEAFRAYLAHLAPNGLLVVQRWLQLPPTEEIRAGALLRAALEASGVRAPARNLIAVRSFSTMLLLAKREPFDARELEAVKTLARERQFDLVYYPGIQRQEANRFNVLRRDVYFESFQDLLADPARFYAQYEYDIAPPTDDRPFFFHFFKWRQLPMALALLGKMWQPFGGSGFLILLALLGLTLLLSSALVVLPLLVMGRRGAKARSIIRPLVYFGALGLGFLFVEAPLIQRLMLLLDYPVYAFTVVLFGLMIFSGVGSMFAARVPWRGALAALIVVLAIYPALLDQVCALLIGQDFAVRVVIALILLAPLGLALGIPFPRGLGALSRNAPELIPLAWGVNGFTSVLGSILATLLALTWGLGLVFVGAAALYGLALLTCPASTAQKSPR